MQRSRYKRDRTSNIKSKKNIYIVLTIIIFVTLILIFIWKVYSVDKFIYLNHAPNGDAEIILIDTKNNRTNKYLVSGEVELDAAKGYGRYKIKNLWTLSTKDESRGGLVSDSFVINYSLPIYLWKDGSKSNLSLIQKIKAKFVESNKNIFVDKIAESSIPKSVYINFVDQHLSDNLSKIDVQDLTGDNVTIEKVSNILEVLGGKITTNSNGYNSEMDCEISGSDKRIILTVNKIFRCKIVDHSDKSVDMTIKLGVKFAERF